MGNLSGLLQQIAHELSSFQILGKRKAQPAFKPELCVLDEMPFVKFVGNCCRAAYGVALLHDGLGVNLDDASLLFTETIISPNGQPVVLDWTLGKGLNLLPNFSNFKCLNICIIFLQCKE